MAEYVDGSEKAPLSSSSAAGGGAGRRPARKPDWTRFGLQSGGDGDGRARSRPGDDDARADEDAGEVNEIYAEHEVQASHNLTAAPANYRR